MTRMPIGGPDPVPSRRLQWKLSLSLALVLAVYIYFIVQPHLPAGCAANRGCATNRAHGKCVHCVQGSNPVCNVTIVSGYYELPASHKHNPAEYRAWMRNFLSLCDCMVILVAPEFETVIKSMRPNLPLVLYPRREEELASAKLLNSEGWKKQEEMDPEQNLHLNRYVYWIWNEKVEMMKIVSEANPFNSKYFVWMDIGYVRHERFNNEWMVRKVPNHRGCAMLNSNPFTSEDLALTEGKSLVDFGHVGDRIGAGVMGCDKKNVALWHAAYYATVQSYLSRGKFIGKDQNMMATTCAETDLCALVSGHFLQFGFKYMDWFRLQQFFRGDIEQTFVPGG